MLAVLGAVASAAEVEVSLDVREATLSNGLRVLVVPRAGNPRAACRLVYGVGTVTARPGITGISHLLEHMMFKGTERIGVTDIARDRALIAEIDAAHDEWQAALAKGEEAAALTARERFDSLVADEKKVIVKDELWRLYQTAGASGLNAFTSEDITAYIVTLPANRAELFFWLESDRMQNAVMREFHSEREVVKEERRLRTVNTPTGPFWETLTALHFTAHPYRWPVVGWMTDLDAMRREDLVEYRRVYYTPRNAVLCIAGGVDPDRMIELAKRYFEAIPSGPVPPKVATVEPPQQGRKRYETTARAAPTAAVLWHIPDEHHPDMPALEVLGSLLTGETGRLETRLVRQLGIARDASANADARQYPSYFSAEATAAGDTDPAELLAAIEAEVRRLQNEPVAEEELVRVRNQAVARSVRSMRRLSWLAVSLAIAELHGDWRDAVERPNRILAVTAEDVMRVAKKYLTEENSTVGLLRREKEVSK